MEHQDEPRGDHGLLRGWRDRGSGGNALHGSGNTPRFCRLAYPGVHPDSITIPKDAPPTFLVVADDDRLAAAAAAYYGKLKAQTIPAELHIYAKGGHGFGMTGRTTEFRNLVVSHWPEALESWLRFS